MRLITNKFTNCISLLMLFYFGLLQSNYVLAGKIETDSLKLIFQSTKSDTVAFNTLLKLGDNWKSISLDSAMYYYNKALKLTLQNNWMDKKAKVLVNVGLAYFKSPHPKVSIGYLQKSLVIYKVVDDKKGQMNAYYYLGYLYATFEDFTKAIENFHRAVGLASELENESRLADLYNDLGLINYYIGQYDKANEYIMKSLEINNKTGGKKLDTSYINMVLLYTEHGSPEKNLKYYFKVLKIFLKSKDKQYIALAYKSIGDDYRDMHQFDSAKKYYGRAYVLYKELGDHVSLSCYYMDMATIYQKQGMLKKAALIYRQALDTLPENGSRKLLFAIYSNIVDLNLILADSSINNKVRLRHQAIAYAVEMKQIAHDLGSVSMEIESYEKLYKVHLKSGNTKYALEYADKYIVSKDSLSSLQKQETFANMQTKYETEKKELQIDHLYSEKKLLSKNIEQDKVLRKSQYIVIYLLLLGFIVTFVFGIILYKFYRQTKIANIRLIVQKDIIFKQNEEKEVLLKEIHHRVKNNLQIISSLLNLQTKDVEDASALSAIADGQSRVRAMALIHQKLYQNNDISTVKLNEYIAQLLNEIAGLYPELSNVKREICVSGIELDVDTAIPVGLILSELITNAYKYAFAGGEGTIALTLIQTEYNYVLTVRDSGPGLPKGFDMSAASSVGLRLIRRLSRQLYGITTYEYENGSKFVVIFKDAFLRKKTV